MANVMVVCSRAFSASQALHGKLIQTPTNVFGVAGQYASALYSASVKQKQLELIETETKTFAKLLLESPQIKAFLENPVIKKYSKQAFIIELAKAQNYSKLMSSFLDTVIENNRMKHIDRILGSFDTIMSAYRGEVLCEVTTAKALETQTRKELEAALKGFFNGKQKLLLHCKVDPSIIGGMIVSIGDKYVDMSISRKIKAYEELISVPI